MSDFFIDLVDFNENVNYGSFVLFFCSYLLLLWLVISIWVGVDASRRFQNKYIAFGFFVLTLVLNFPILIFYFIVRPEMKIEDYQEWEAQGVSVPLVNFKGEKGVEMVLELKMHPANIVEAQRDMKVDVSWESPKPEMELVQQKQVLQNKLDQTSDKKDVLPRGDQKVTNVFSKFGFSVKKRITRFKEVSADYASRARKRVKVTRVESSDEKKTEKLDSPKVQSADMNQNSVSDQENEQQHKKKDKSRKRKLKKNKKR